MAGRSSKNASGPAQAVRRAWPFVLMAWERWQSLSEEEKERYKQHARDLAAKGRDVAADVRAQVEQQTGSKKRRR